MRGGWGGGGRVEGDGGLGCGSNVEELMGRDGRAYNNADSENIWSLSRICRERYWIGRLLWMGRVAIDWTGHGWMKGQGDRHCNISEIYSSTTIARCTLASRRRCKAS
jgi:hypothetical protein